jgi:hypothetical protein
VHRYETVRSRVCGRDGAEYFWRRISLCFMLADMFLQQRVVA